MRITDENKINELLKTDWDEQIDGMTMFINGGQDVLCLCKNLKDDEEYYQIDTYISQNEQVHLYDINSFKDEKVPNDYIWDDIIYVKGRDDAYSVFNNLIAEKSAI
jgi:hypothetical protein